MAGVTGAGVFASPQPLNISGGSSRSSSGSGSTSGAAKTQQFKMPYVKERLLSGLKEDIVGPEGKAQRYYYDLAAYNTQVTDFYTRWETKFAYEYQGNYSAFMAYEGQNLKNDTANLLLAKADLNMKANMLANEQQKMEKSNIAKMDPNTIMYDENGRIRYHEVLLEEKDNEGNNKKARVPMTTGDYMRDYRSSGWEQEFKDYIPPDSGAMDDIIKNKWDQVRKSSVETGKDGTTFTIDEYQTGVVIQKTFDDIMNNPKARQWYLIGQNKKLNDFGSLTEEQLGQQIINNQKALQSQSQNKNISDTDLQAMQANNQLYFIEYNKRQLMKENKWNDASQVKYESEFANAYNTKWMADQAVIHTPKIYTAEQQQKVVNNTLHDQFVNGEIGQFSQKRMDFPTTQEQIQEKVRLGSDYNAIVDNKKFIKVNEDKMKAILSDAKSEKTFQYNIDGKKVNAKITEVDTGISVDQHDPSFVSVSMSGIPSYQIGEQKKTPVKNINDKFDVNKIQRFTMTYIDPDTRKEITREITPAELMNVEGANFKVNGTLNKNVAQDTDGSYVLNSVYYSQQGTSIPYTDVPKEFSDETLAGDGATVYPGSMKILSSEKVNGSNFIDIPFGGHIVGVTKVASDLGPNSQFATQGNENGRPPQFVMVVSKEELKAASDKTNIDYLEKYDDYEIYVNDDKNNPGIGVKSTEVMSSYKYFFGDDSKLAGLVLNSPDDNFYLVPVWGNDLSLLNIKTTSADIVKSKQRTGVNIGSITAGAIEN